jgi:hypothetical protein
LSAMHSACMRRIWLRKARTSCCISSNWPCHRETKSNYEFRPPYDLSLLLLDSPIPRWRAPRWDRLPPRYELPLDVKLPRVVSLAGRWMR